MASRTCAWLTVFALSTFVFSGLAGAETQTARMGTFEKDGRDYFALSLMPQASADAAQKNDVVILVDTSASQAGRYRAEEIAALTAMLSSLGPNDRVQLMAVDMKAVPLSAGFVAANGPEMQAALANLNARTPLGATDLEAGLRTAANSFAADGRARTVIYVGDAMSKANMLTDAAMNKLVGDLRGERVSVSSYVLGQQQNTQLMAALANHTGGVVETAAPETDTVTSGRRLAASVQASVLWPNASSLSSNVAESFPAQMPPVRTDRDSVLIGLLSNQAAVNVELNGTMNGKPTKWSWTTKPEKASEDFAFLPKLVEIAEADKGISLPTAGSNALRQAAYVTMNSAQQLAKLGNEALASGNFSGAMKVAEAALARDPGNPEAIAIKEAAKKGLAAAKGPATTEPELKLGGLREPTAPSGLLAEVLAEPPGFLGRVEEERRVLSGKMQAEVDNALVTANRTMGASPEQAENDLKLTLEGVERTPELEPEVRTQLRRKIENTIRAARQAKIRVDQAVAVAQEQKAAAAEQERLNDALAIQTSRIKQVVDRFESLMAEQRYALADETITPEIHKLATDTSIDYSVTQGGRMIRNVNEINNVVVQRHNNYLRTLFTVEQSFVPFPDEPPIVYMPAEQWEDLTIRRQKYKAVDLGKQGGAEQRIFSELGKNTTIDVVEMPLKDVVLYLTETHNIPIVLSLKKLEEASVSADTPVTKSLRGVTLRSALRLILKDLELTYVIRDEVMQITTPEDAESQLITKVYPVGDLVIPIMSGGGMGGMGGMMGGMGGMMGGMGGGMGGMMGGMGGGMGGMGGGMGGMGGGMGGMGMGGMGGGMGGMFAVDDELTLGAKKPTAAAEAPAPAVAAPQPAAPASRPAPVKAKRIAVKPQGEETPAAAWDRYFAGEEQRIADLSTSDDAASRSRTKEAMAHLLAAVRETVRQLMSEKKYGETATLIEAAIRHGEVESWMYEALSLAIRADSLDKINRGMKLDEAQTEELERALLSAVDFAQDEDQLVMVGAYMAQAGLEKRALAVYQQVAKLNPSRPEAYLQGLAIAKRLNDVPGIEWACVGILSQAWSAEQRELADQAFRIGKATYGQLLADGKKAEAEAFDAAIRKAQERDCVVVVTWTGDADVDLSVEEPSGTLVSQRAPRSTSGGVHLGDVSSADSKSTTKGFSEAYVCPEGFAGDYRMMVRKVWGQPTSDVVTIDIYTHYGSSNQSVIHEQIPLKDKNRKDSDALITFQLDKGRRKDALPEAQVEQVAKIQNAANRAILAQQLASGSNNSPATSFGNSLNTGLGLGLVPGFFLRGAVGYRPVIQNFPTGANMSSNAVISADRRYVRVSPSPTFSQITSVSTFNFVTGSGMQTQGGTSGFGGAGIGGSSSGSSGGSGTGGTGGGGTL